MKVIANEPVAHRRLWRNTLERRMRVDHSTRRIESGIRDAQHAHAAIIMRHVLYESVDRIVGIRRFIDVLRTSMIAQDGPHMNKRPFGTIPAAHILQRENELLLG